MAFLIYIFFKTALSIAVDDQNIEIVRLLLGHPKIDVNHTFTIFI